MDRAINVPDHGNNVVNGINATDKNYLKEKMELLGKLASNDTSNIGIITSASKYVSIKFAETFTLILNNNNRLNGH